MRVTLSAVLLALALLVSGTVAGVPITERDSSTNAQNEADIDASFEKEVLEGHQNDTVSIPIVLDGTDTATVKIGGKVVNYALVASVTDVDGDGRVVLAFDTETAGTDATSISVTGDDEVSLESETELEHPPLVVGNYPLSLYSGTTIDQENETDAATMTLIEPKATTTRPTTLETTGTSETTEKPMQSTTETETTTSSGSGVPGFGPVIALVALAAAALLAARR